MKLPNHFYKPLAIGAPAPFRELPVRPERVVHFFPPHIDKLMRYRIGILDQHGIKLSDIQAVIGTLAPLPGARSSSTSCARSPRSSS